MNIFGFLAIVVICGTVGVLGWRFSKSGVTITKHVYTETKDTTPKVVQQVMSEEDKKRMEKEINAKFEAAKAMDAVIASANKLMGIDVEEDANNDRKE